MTSLIHSLRKNITLLGAPGSGKGSYGRLLAKRWGIELVTVSEVLRKCRPHLMQQQAQTGTLIDDQVVSDALLEHLYQRHQNKHKKDDDHHDPKCMSPSNAASPSSSIIVDGFPRTLQQVQLMEQQWPPELQISLAIHLDVPVDVCQQKLLGRRFCTKCGGNYNTSHVQHGEFHLPPTLPQRKTKTPLPPPPTTTTSTTNTTKGSVDSGNGNVDVSCCDPAIHWSIREDDSPHVVQQRLLLHTRHMPPILQHYQTRKSIFRFQPYRGWADVDRFHHSLEQWLIDLHPPPKHRDDHEQEPLPKPEQPPSTMLLL